MLLSSVCQISVVRLLRTRHVACNRLRRLKPEFLHFSESGAHRVDLGGIFCSRLQFELCQPWTSVQRQTRENALSSKDRALALVRMQQARPSTRAFFVSPTKAGRGALLQSDRLARLLVEALAENRQKRRFLLHDSVIIPNHFHLLLTPTADVAGKSSAIHQGRFLQSRGTGNSFCFCNMATEFCESGHSRLTGLQVPPHLHLRESRQSGLERQTRAVCVALGFARDRRGSRTTRAKESA